MKIKLKIWITNNKDESFIGVGLIWLLQRIKKFKSINSAAKDMNMSYVKAIKMLNRLEKNLGKKVIIRNRGGNKRCRTELTPLGEELIKQYDLFQKKIKQFAEKEFEKCLKVLEGRESK